MLRLEAKLRLSWTDVAAVSNRARSMQVHAEIIFDKIVKFT
jgi:hypothetical protein